jgi:UDP-N-acetylmuramoyl-tripeptide--D-alanyl-D-alanine ligase
MTVLWTGSELLAAAQGRATAALPDILGISIDSRTIQPGELFIALEGPNFDGHDFVGKALATGAVALVARVPDGLAADAKLILVDDTLHALERLGAAARARSTARIVAVTGSVGKTSTKEMLAAALRASGATHASAGSFNNQWGVPLSLARMPRDAAYGVFELGMNHAGEIAGLTTQVQPHVAIVTTIEPAHLEFFESVEAIADAKAEIFLGLEADGTVLLNRDNPQFERLAAAARRQGLTRILGFGAAPEAEIRLTGLAVEGEAMQVEVSLLGRTFSYRLGVPGRHMALNSLAVLAAADALGADLATAATALGSISSLAGRGKRLSIEVAGGTATLIDESYNASPAAMRAAIAVLAAASPGPGGRRIAVLGDMRELGHEGPALHAALAEPLVEAGIDQVFTVGPLMRALWDRLPAALRGASTETAAGLVPGLITALRAGDVLTVKGSLGTRMADIVKPLSAGLAAAAKDRPC